MYLSQIANCKKKIVLNCKMQLSQIVKFNCVILQNVFVSNCKMCLSQITKCICLTWQNVFFSNSITHDTIGVNQQGWRRKFMGETVPRGQGLSMCPLYIYIHINYFLSCNFLLGVLATMFINVGLYLWLVVYLACLYSQLNQLKISFIASLDGYSVVLNIYIWPHVGIDFVWQKDEMLKGLHVQKINW